MPGSAFEEYFNPRAGMGDPARPIPIYRAAVSFRNSNHSRYLSTHISDDKVVTLCGLIVPPVVWMKGPRNELPYINTHAVDCKVCLDTAGIGQWH